MLMFSLRRAAMSSHTRLMLRHAPCRRFTEREMYRPSPRHHEPRHAALRAAEVFASMLTRVAMSPL